MSDQIIELVCFLIDRASRNYPIGETFRVVNPSDEDMAVVNALVKRFHIVIEKSGDYLFVWFN